MIPRALQIAIAFLFGLLFGSFYNCMAMRIVRGQNWVSDRSRCPHCAHELGAADLIPLVSFGLTRGKCRYCNERISLRYPVTELLFGCITALIMWRFGLSFNTIRYFIFAGALFVLTLTDLEERLIPNGCILAALIGWAATEPWLFVSVRDLLTHIGAMAGFVIAILAVVFVMDRILKKDSMGGGDVKLIGVLALYLGPVSMMFALFFSCMLGIGYAVLARRFRRGEAVAFGPCLSAAGFLMAIFGDPLVNWYLSFLMV